MVGGPQNKSMKKILLVNFFGILLIIILLEFVSNFFKLSGLMGIQKGLVYEKDETHFLYPDKEGVIFDEKVFTDRYGYRVPTKNFRYKYKNNTFILGDSVTFGNGVKEENTFVGLMRKKFKDQNFLNSSVPGYQLKDHVKILKGSTKFKNVNNILYFFTLNDIYGSSNITNLDNKKKDESDYDLKKIQLFNKLNAYLRNKSYLYMLIKGIGTDPSKRWFLNLEKEYGNINSSQIRKQFTSLKKFSESTQSNLVVIILPYEYQTRNCSKNVLNPQSKIIEILDTSKINFRDFTNHFCNQKNPNKNFYKFDPMHLSKNGHMLVFEKLKNEINF